jgi:hypothetical protein
MKEAAMGLSRNRYVLEGIPKIAFFSGGPRCPEDVCLPSVLRAITEFLKEKEYGCAVCGTRPGAMRCAYSYFMGVTGAAFYLSWKDGWHMDNAAAAYADVDPLALEKAACAAMGRSLVVLETGKTGKREILEAIESGLARGMPAISYGLYGPPEAGIIAGYDEGGDTLVGWNFFQAFEPGTETEASGYYRKRGWEASLAKIAVLGEKGEKPRMSETFRKAIAFGIKAMENPMVRPGPDAPEEYRNRHNGLSAYDAWSMHLLADAGFSEEESLRTRYQVHDNVVGTLAETRWYGSVFLSSLGPYCDAEVHRDAIEDLTIAAGHFAGIHKLMYDLWALTGGIGNPEGWRALAGQETRRKMSDVILSAREKDAQALARLKSALPAMQDP